MILKTSYTDHQIFKSGETVIRSRFRLVKESELVSAYSFDLPGRTFSNMAYSDPLGKLPQLGVGPSPVGQGNST